MHYAAPAGSRERAFNVPGLVLAFIGLLVLVQVVREWLNEADDVRLLLDLAFIPAAWSVAFGAASPDAVLASARAAGEDGGALREALARYAVSEGFRPASWLTYAALHGSWMHLGLNGVWLLAFGSPVVRRLGTLRAVALGVASAAGGALAQWISQPLGVQPMIGASAVVSGFMGAAATFVFVRPSGSGEGSGSPWAFLTNRNAVVFLAVWLVVNLLFGLLAGPLGVAGGGVAWQAHIGGLIAGLALFPALNPRRGRPRARSGAA